MMAWRRPGDKPLSEPMLVRIPTYICVTRPQWFNTPGLEESCRRSAEDIFIEVWTKWSTICWRKFQLHFLWRNFGTFYSNFTAVQGSQVMVWCRTGDKPLFEPIKIQCTDAFVRYHHGSVIWAMAHPRPGDKLLFVLISIIWPPGIKFRLPGMALFTLVTLTSWHDIFSSAIDKNLMSTDVAWMGVTKFLIVVIHCHSLQFSNDLNNMAILCLYS